MRISRIVGAFLALTLLLGACSDDDSDDASEATTTELPAEVTQLLDDYGAAVEASDGDAVLGYLTEDFTWTSAVVCDQNRDDYAAAVSRYVDFEAESIGERTAIGGENHYVVSSPERVNAAGLRDGLSVYQVVQSGDTWLISSHSFTELRGS